MHADDIRAQARRELFRRDFAKYAAIQLKIRPRVGPISPFRLNGAQRLLDDVVSRQLREKGYTRIVVLKARQWGCSSYWAARGFHAASLNENTRTHIIAQDKDTTAHIFEMDRLFFAELEPEMRPMHRYSSKQELVWENPKEDQQKVNPGLRSKITFQTAGRRNPGTGQTIQFLHASECAKYESTDFLDTSLFPTVSKGPGTSIVLESTAFPSGEWFRAHCDQARSGRSMYEFVFVPWYIIEEYAMPLDRGENLHLTGDEKFLVKKYGLTVEQLKWRRATIEEFGGDGAAEQKFEQEFPKDPDSAWQNFDLMVFDHRKLYEANKHVRPPVAVYNVIPGPVADRRHFRMLRDDRGEFMVWKEPEPGEAYDVGIDVASGTTDGDYSVCEVILRRTREQVAEWRGFLDPLRYAETCMAIGYYYNEAQLGCEIEGIGFATNDAIVLAGYGNVYRWRQRGRSVPTLSSFSGWKSQFDAKSLMVAQMKHHLFTDTLIVRSKVLMNELRNFVEYPSLMGSIYRGGNRTHDDCVMSFGIALMIAHDESFGQMEPVIESLPKAPADPRPTVDPNLIVGPEEVRPRGFVGGGGLDGLVDQLRGWR